MKQQGASGDSLRCRDNPSRVDAVGRALAGSQRQIQIYVNGVYASGFMRHGATTFV
jgi:hypothetical protein